MFDVNRSLPAILALVLSLWPASSSAQPQEPLRVDQVRDAFGIAGYDVDPVDAWTWTTPPVTTFQVRDPGQDRVLLVLVYASMTAAQAARGEAEAHEQAWNGRASLNAEAGPHLVAGWGPSTWSGNVALVQTAQSELVRAYQVQVDQDGGGKPGLTAEGNESVRLVDADFQEVLRNSTARL